METFSIGIELTVGQYFEVEANSVKEAISKAKQEAEESSNIGGREGWHYVGVKPYSW